MITASRNDLCDVKVEADNPSQLGVSDLNAGSGKDAKRRESLVLKSPNGQDPTMAVSGAAKRRREVYSRKVFVGGLPHFINAESIETIFSQYGVVSCWWPNKNEAPSSYPPKGFCFLQFQEEDAVYRLLNACLIDGSSYFTVIPSDIRTNKLVQIRPWALADEEAIIDIDRLDPRKAVFVGGVPRSLKAFELAKEMSDLFGPVSYAAIDTDLEMRYPKGSAKVFFCDRQSMISAISARFIHLNNNEIDMGRIFTIEIRPRIIQTKQGCDDCRGKKPAKFFCGNVACLLYLCNDCWAKVHMQPGRNYHRPLLQNGKNHHAERASAHPQARNATTE